MYDDARRVQTRKPDSHDSGKRMFCKGSADAEVFLGNDQAMRTQRKQEKESEFEDRK